MPDRSIFGLPTLGGVWPTIICIAAVAWLVINLATGKQKNVPINYILGIVALVTAQSFFPNVGFPTMGIIAFGLVAYKTVASTKAIGNKIVRGIVVGIVLTIALILLAILQYSPATVGALFDWIGGWGRDMQISVFGFGTAIMFAVFSAGDRFLRNENAYKKHATMAVICLAATLIAKVLLANATH